MTFRHCDPKDLEKFKKGFEQLAKGNSDARSGDECRMATEREEEGDTNG